MEQLWMKVHVRTSTKAPIRSGLLGRLVRKKLLHSKIINHGRTSCTFTAKLTTKHVEQCPHQHKHRNFQAQCGGVIIWAPCGYWVNNELLYRPKYFRVKCEAIWQLTFDPNWVMKKRIKGLQCSSSPKCMKLDWKSLLYLTLDNGGSVSCWIIRCT